VRTDEPSPAVENSSPEEKKSEQEESGKGHRRNSSRNLTKTQLKKLKKRRNSVAD
jgi:hypothetical protein